MSLSKLPKQCDPVKMAQENFQFSGELDVANLERIQPWLPESPKPAWVTVGFSFDERARVKISGSIYLELQQTCGRCLQTLLFNVDGEFCLIVVDSDEKAKQLPDCYEPLLLTENSLQIDQMLEDEIILNIPIEIKHSNTQCNEDSIKRQQAQGDLKNPFADLKQLLKKGDSSN